MTAHKTGADTILLVSEVGGDEGQHIQRNAVYVNEGVSPFADICQCGRDPLVELRNIFESEAVEEVSTSSSNDLTGGPILIFRHAR